jgi:hypothetical protein
MSMGKGRSSKPTCQSVRVGDVDMRLPRVRFTLRRMMATVAVVGLEFGLITAGANGMGREPTARDWLVSTAFVIGL